MIVVLNGKNTEVDCGMTLLEFLNLKGLEINRVIVECNFEIARKEDWGGITLKDNDNLEVLRFVGGG